MPAPASSTESIACVVATALALVLESDVNVRAAAYRKREDERTEE